MKLKRNVVANALLTIALLATNLATTDVKAATTHTSRNTATLTTTGSGGTTEITQTLTSVTDDDTTQ